MFEINLTECRVSVTEAGCLPSVTKMKLFLLNTALYRVSTTPGNTGNLLEFEIPPGNTGNLLDFC